MELSEFLYALISDENLLTMPRMRLAFDIMDNGKTKRVPFQKIMQMVKSALEKASLKDGIKLSEETIRDAIQLQDDQQEKQVIHFADFCNILLNLHVFYAIEKKQVENAKYAANVAALTD